MKKFVQIASSFFGVGYLPLAPGTFGSAAGLLIAWFSPDQVLGPAVLFLSLLGLALCKPAQGAFESPDPAAFVLDEVCGMMVGLLGLPKDATFYTAAFLLFRLLDVFKPWPIRLIQNSHRPSSIMWDDLAAGFLANLTLQILSRIL